MFEAAELGRKASKDDYRTQVPALRGDLLDLQVRLRTASFPVILLFAGVDGAGKGETVNLLNEWMDPRWTVTRSFGPPSDEEAERPESWRFWRDLPPRGRIAMFLSSWYSTPVLDRVYRRLDADAFDERLHRIVEFEQTLVDDGALILKFWMHLGRKAQRERLETLERDKLTRWRVTKREWKHWRMYDRFVETAERAIRRTSRGNAPWMIVEGADSRYRELTVGCAIRDALRHRLEEDESRRRARGPKRANGGESASAAALRSEEELGKRLGRSAPSILSSLDMKRSVPKKRVDAEMERWQGRIHHLQREAAGRGTSTVLVFEGWDAAGKGGAIRRVVGALDAGDVRVIPIASPTDEERAHHYLWRFWRHLSRAGRVTVFDRSWYGRVLVERVEGFATGAEWMRAYAEINQFEDQLVRHGIALAKFWLHVTPDEQLRRFKSRERTPHKRWKLTDEDWRNRKRWPEYERAVNDMIARTSTRVAPWTIVEGNDKGYARIKVLRTVCRRMEEALGG